MGVGRGGLKMGGGGGRGRLIVLFFDQAHHCQVMNLAMFS
jgi:hypothetical protein